MNMRDELTHSHTHSLTSKGGSVAGQSSTRAHEHIEMVSQSLTCSQGDITRIVEGVMEGEGREAREGPELVSVGRREPRMNDAAAVGG